MQIPKRSTPVQRCVQLSIFAQAALRRYATLFAPPPDVAARLESLAVTLGTSTDVLSARHADYQAAVLALIGPRVELKLVDLHADAVVRSVKRAADEAGTGGAVFPGGVVPIVKPIGATEVAALRTLEGRIAAATAWGDREAQRARVEAARLDYEGALARRGEARVAASDARALRDDAKESFLDTYFAVASAVREIFPRDRVRQDVFFDEVYNGRSHRDRDEDDDEPEAPES